MQAASAWIGRPGLTGTFLCACSSAGCECMARVSSSQHCIVCTDPQAHLKPDLAVRHRTLWFTVPAAPSAAIHSSIFMPD